MKLLIIGPQASGKGTQAERLARRLSIPHLSSGDMFRAERQRGTPLGKRIAAMMDRGELIPDEVTWEMVRGRLAEHPEGWLLDGYPRTLAQAGLLDAHDPPERVLLLEVADKLCVARISGRRICETCGKDYHVTYKPPRAEGRCDLDGGRLVQRPDDNPEAVRTRLAAYHEQTEPLLRHYEEILVRVDGSGGIEEVAEAIAERLGA